MKLSLNIGCGKTSFGDIRLDISKSSRANIIADAQYLPFKDNIFCMAYASHVLEHVKEPHQMLTEMRRVTVVNAPIVLRVPNAIHQFEFHPHEQHLYMWNKTLFERLLSTVFSDVKVTSSINKQTHLSRYTLIWGMLFNIWVRIFHNELRAYCRNTK